MCGDACSCDKLPTDIDKILLSIKSVAEEKKSNLLSNKVKVDYLADDKYNVGWEIGYEAGVVQGIEYALELLNKK